MDIIMDIFILWGMIAVCITPILLGIQLRSNIRWYKKFYEEIISRQKAKVSDIE